MAPQQKKVEKSVFDSLSEEQKKDFFISSLEKRVRNVNKKLKEIKQLEAERKEGKELKESQLQKIAAKAELSDKIREIESMAQFYLEAKEENAAAESSAAVASVVQTANSVAQLYFAASYAKAQSTDSQLSALYTRVFEDTSAQRVDLASAELVAYLTGKRSLVESAVAQTLNLQGFSSNSSAVDVVPVAAVETAVEEETQVVLVQEVAEVAAPAQPETVAEVEETPVVVVVVDEAQVEVEAPVEEVVVTAGADAETTTAAAADAEPTVDADAGAAAAGDEATTGTEGQKRRGNANRGPRKPKETKEGEEGEKRAPRPPRTNRPPREGGNKSAQNDGWNVVRKGPATNEGQKYRNNNNNNNNNNNKENRGSGERKPFNPEHKRAFNKERPNQNGTTEYVRKDKVASAAAASQSTTVQVTATN